MRKVLLLCGIVSSLLYVATDALATLRYKGYNYKAQAVSELAAIGAPTRRLVVSLFTLYNLLLIAFVGGIWKSASGKRTPRPAAALLGASAAVGAVVQPYFPMHRRGEQTTTTDTMHPALTAVSSLFILLSMAFAAGLHGRRFRDYTAGTMLTLVAFGVWTAADAPRRGAGWGPTPWMGVKERVNIYAYLLWIGALAVSLWRRPAAGTTRSAPAPGRGGR